jgi:hypothetical protein
VRGFMATTWNSPACKDETVINKGWYDRLNVTNDFEIVFSVVCLKIKVVVNIKWLKK